MLPLGGDQGWSTETISGILNFPRNEAKLPFVAKSLLTSSDLVYQVRYELQKINLYNSLDELILQLAIPEVISVDLTFDQLDRRVIVWELPDNQVWLHWYDPISSSYVTVEVAEGNNPCCMIDERRANLISNSDVFIFYQRGDEVFYRLQRERYLIEHEIPHQQSMVTLETCGMATNFRMTLRTLTIDAHLVMHGDRYMAIGSDYLALPYGEDP